MVPTLQRPDVAPRVRFPPAPARPREPDRAVYASFAGARPRTHDGCRPARIGRRRCPEHARYPRGCREPSRGVRMRSTQRRLPYHRCAVAFDDVPAAVHDARGVDVRSGVHADAARRSSAAARVRAICSREIGRSNARMSASSKPARVGERVDLAHLGDVDPAAERVRLAAVLERRAPSSRTCTPAPCLAASPCRTSRPARARATSASSPGTRMLPPSTTSTSGRSSATRRLTSCGSESSQTTAPGAQVLGLDHVLRRRRRRQHEIGAPHGRR